MGRRCRTELCRSRTDDGGASSQADNRPTLSDADPKRCSQSREGGSESRRGHRSLHEAYRVLYVVVSVCCCGLGDYHGGRNRFQSVRADFKLTRVALTRGSLLPSAAERRKSLLCELNCGLTGVSQTIFRAECDTERDSSFAEFSKLALREFKHARGVTVRARLACPHGAIIFR